MNFAEIVREFTARNAIVQLPELDEKEIPARLAEVFSRLLSDAEQRKTLGENAFALVEKNRGATEKTLELLKPYLRVTGNL